MQPASNPPHPLTLVKTDDQEASVGRIVVLILRFEFKDRLSHFFPSFQASIKFGANYSLPDNLVGSFLMAIISPYFDHLDYVSQYHFMLPLLCLTKMSYSLTLLPLHY